MTVGFAPALLRYTGNMFSCLWSGVLSRTGDKNYCKTCVHLNIYLLKELIKTLEFYLLKYWQKICLVLEKSWNLH